MNDNRMDDVLKPWEQQRIVANAVTAMIEDQALIERVTGMVMFVQGVEADCAFEILCAQARRHRIQVVVMAEQMLMDFVGLSTGVGREFRVPFKNQVLTGHQCITHIAPRKR